MKKFKALLPELKTYLNEIENEFDSIPEKRKVVLNKLAHEIKKEHNEDLRVKLNFICTHNSRRSIMSQIWAQTAAFVYDISNVFCYSGGIEETAFNTRSVRALRKAGFNIMQKDKSDNPIYHTIFSESEAYMRIYSKDYNEDSNPQEDFIAVITCSDADKNCPVVFGAAHRYSVTYEDPKIFDNTPKEEEAYDERTRQIATEMFYLFSKVI